MLMVLAPALAGCGDGPTAPGPEGELTVRRTSAHGVYYHSPGDSVEVVHQEQYYLWLLARMNVEPAQRLVYFKYRDPSQMERLTGEATNGWAEVGTYRFHTIWELDNHESVHALVSAEWNLAPALMNEGFATAHQTLPHLDLLEPQWSGTPLDVLAAQALEADRMPRLDALLDNRDFFRFDDTFIYPIAGSFVGSVIDRHGYGRIEAFFRGSAFEDPPDRLRANFRAAFGEEIEEAWAIWLQSL